MEYLKVLVLLATLFLYETTVEGTVTEKPTDQVVLQGGSATFKCSIDFDRSKDAFRWERISTSDGTKREKVFQAFPKDDPYDEIKYTIDRPKNHTCNLIVNNVNDLDAGTYICSLVSDTAKSASADLAVLEKPLVTLPKWILDGSEASIQCDVEFARRLKKDDDRLTPTLTVRMGNMDISNRGLLKTEEGELGKITSRLSFSYNDTFSKTLNGKNVTCTAKTSNPRFEVTGYKTIQITFPVTEESIQFEPERESYFVGETIACTAEGGPAPTVKWTPIESPGAHISGPNLTITEQMVGENKWECTAENTPKDVPVRVKKTITFSVIPPTEPAAGESKGIGSKCCNRCENTKPDPLIGSEIESRDLSQALPQEGASLPETECRDRRNGSEATIAIGVAVPLVVIIILVIVICCVCQRKKKGAAVKKPEGEGRKQPPKSDPIYRPVNKADHVTIQDSTTAKYRVESEESRPTAAPRREAKT